MPVNIKNQQKKEEAPLEEEKKQSSFMDRVNNYLLKYSRVPLKEKLFFVQHLGIMLKAGISLSRALKTLSQQTENKRFTEVLDDLAEKVEKGTSFTQSLKNHEKIFGELFISMIEAGELSGKLEEVLGKLYIQMKKEHALLSKVKGALTYPAVIVIAMLGIGTFMMVVIIPRMTSMFKDLGADLPLPTKILIGLSDAIINNGLLTVIILVVLIVVIVKTLKTYKGKYYFQALLLKAPVFSPIIKKINLARFARNISSLMKTDILIIKTFQITANVMGNLHYRKSLQDMAEKIKKGGKLTDVINEYPKLFPPVVVQMVAVGEETGELDSILIELAEFYESEVDQIMENLPSIIEPLLILLLGIGVGGVAIAIVMPMYSITSAID